MNPVLTRGSIDVVERVADVVHIHGWCASFEPFAVLGAVVEVAGRERPVVGLDIRDTPDIAEWLPFLSGVERCRFIAAVPVPVEETLGGALVSVRLRFQAGRTGLPLFHVVQPAVAFPGEEVVGSVGGGQGSGLEFLRYLVGLAELAPEQHVLDIGCGVGRMALPLAYYLREPGRYTGFDIVPESIGWAREHLSPVFPSLDFHRVDVRNGMYNPEGAKDPLTFSFPLEDGVVDVAFLASVFTHMLGGEVRHYLDEIARVLKPGGRALVSCFLLDSTARALMADGRSDRTFETPMDDAFVQWPEEPEEAVAYDDMTLIAWCGERGLGLEARLHGFWSGRAPAMTYQDLILLRCT